MVRDHLAPVISCLYINDIGLGVFFFFWSNNFTVFIEIPTYSFFKVVMWKIMSKVKSELNYTSHDNSNEVLVMLNSG